MNLTDLTKIIGLSMAAFALLRVIIGKPLPTKVFNPNRSVWFLVAVGCVFTSVGLLRLNTKSSDPMDWLRALSSLVTEEKAPAQVIIAAFGLFNAGFIFGMLIYCVKMLPHDPSTFVKTERWDSAVRYYTNLKGGLDYAVLIRVDVQSNFEPVILAEGSNPKQIQKQLTHLPSTATVEEQILSWKNLALKLHEQRLAIDSTIAEIRQGVNKRMLLDLSYGGILLQYIKRDESEKVFLYVLAATLSQYEVDSRKFEDHFEMLIDATRAIRSRIYKD